MRTLDPRIVLDAEGMAHTPNNGRITVLDTCNARGYQYLLAVTPKQFVIWHYVNLPHGKIACLAGEFFDSFFKTVDTWKNRVEGCTINQEECSDRSAENPLLALTENM